ncbi:MAG: hypothetical protein H7145_23360 [Akkermansiaceae bacterium]|nr:hypothetical protein [Armatimonadota bacterium]
MNELTMVLDELDSRQSGDLTGYPPQEQQQKLPQASVQKLVAALQSQGGEMARIASVIEILASNRLQQDSPLRYTSPIGNVRMPGNRSDMRTLTAGNGIMTGTGT